MNEPTKPQSWGTGARNRVPVALLGERAPAGIPILNAYFQEILGPRTSGSLLNVGAGDVSVMFDQSAMFAASEYHTLEAPESTVKATYLCYAEDMRGVPNDYYDWVVSVAVFEHVADPWAAAREALRVTKPGGHMYVSVPFSHQVHVGAEYGDFWRFTPQGIAKLFPDCAIREIEIWGDSPIFPNAYAMLLQKTPRSAGDAVGYWWLDFPNEEPWRTMTVDETTTWECPLYSLRVDEMELAKKLHALRGQIDAGTNVFVPLKEVTRSLIPQYAVRLGTLGFRGAQSYLRTY